MEFAGFILTVVLIGLHILISRRRKKLSFIALINHFVNTNINETFKLNITYLLLDSNKTEGKNNGYYHTTGGSDPDRHLEA